MQRKECNLEEIVEILDRPSSAVMFKTSPNPRFTFMKLLGESDPFYSFMML